jgi:hypothetical protein
MSPFGDMERLEIRKKQLENLIQLLERLLDFRRWNFQQTYTHITASLPTIVIYDSEWCRVKFAVGGGDRYGGDEMLVFYGRLHAPNDANVMNWNGEECFCWHQVFDALNFLDGLSPQEAVDQLRVKSEWPRVAEQFKKSKLAKALSGQNHLEWVTRMEAAIWEHYGQRLFELFDLRRHGLWEQYTLFIHEYHRIKGTPVIQGFPSRDKIC